MAKKNKFKEYKIKQYKGITDLLCAVAWSSTMQGGGCTNDKPSPEAEEYYMFMFNGTDENDAKAVELERKRRIKHNEDYIAELKESGEYGKEDGHHTLMLVHDPLFDNQYPPKQPMSSYSYKIIDLSKYNGRDNTTKV